MGDGGGDIKCYKELFALLKRLILSKVEKSMNDFTREIM
jgi:hypothetical protein